MVAHLKVLGGLLATVTTFVAAAPYTSAARWISFAALAFSVVALGLAASALLRVNKYIVEPQAAKVDAIKDGVHQILGPPPPLPPTSADEE